ncbi:hypothetical protein [Caballeronia sp. SEWSISQ10-4 2]|uniref:hypothetical protein n=1 Tax=Caballeronia sp. SEWSISQ10-4 2 TaxID=2937438 RepID=UPI0034633F97
MKKFSMIAISLAVFTSSSAFAQGKTLRRGRSGTDRTAAEQPELHYRNLVPGRQPDVHGAGRPHEAAVGATGCSHSEQRHQLNNKRIVPTAQAYRMLREL